MSPEIGCFYTALALVQTYRLLIRDFPLDKKLTLKKKKRDKKPNTIVLPGFNTFAFYTQTSKRKACCVRVLMTEVLFTSSLSSTLLVFLSVLMDGFLYNMHTASLNGRWP